MNVPKKFSYAEALKFSLTKVIDNWKTFSLISLIWFGLIFVVYKLITLIVPRLGIPLYTIYMFHTQTRVFPLYVLSLPALGIMYPFILLMMILLLFQFLSLGMDLYDNKPISVSRAFTINLITFIKFVGARLLLAFKSTLGLLLFVIPGLYFFTKNYFAGYSIIENPATGILEDASRSAILTQQIKLRLLLVFYVAVVGGILIGFTSTLLTIVFPPLILIGLLAGQIFALIEVHIYKQMKELRLS